MNTLPRIEHVDALDCTFEPRAWPWALQERAAIDAHWGALTAINPHLFNGLVLIQHRTALVEEAGRRVLRGAYQETRYDAFITWRDLGFPDPTMRNCFPMAALLSADGCFMLGEMGAHTSNPGRIYFAAGTPEPRDVNEGRVDMAGVMLRELFEETGIAPAEVVPDPAWVLILLGARIACMRVVRSAMTAREIDARVADFLSRDALPELARLHAWRRAGDVDAARVPPFMQAFLDGAAEAYTG